MKVKFLLPTILLIAVFIGCKKGADDEVHHINCDNLITDTTGTNDPGRIYIPNAFTPNNDGVNDIYRPILSGITSIVFSVYDNTNALVFTSTQIGDAWMPSFVANTSKEYYWKVQAVTNANHRIGMCGEVTYLTCRAAANPMTSYYFEDQLTSFGFTGPTMENPTLCQ